MDDRSISEVPSALGIEGESTEPRLDRLCEEGLSRPGKARFATPEIETVRRIFGATFVRYYRIPQGQAECRRHDTD